MSVRVMTLVWALELPDSEKIVLLALADCANDEGHCWPGMASLARKCSKGERTVQYAIRSLIEAGHLTQNIIVGRGAEYVVHPRNGCTPAKSAPPQRLHQTPATVAPDPRNGCTQTVKNHQEPSEGSSNDDSSSGDEPALRPEHVFEFYQKLAAEIGRPVPRDFTPERRALVRGRISQYSLADFQEVFARCRGSPFLRGDKGRTPLTFDWLMKKANFQKVLEGNYNG